MTSPNFGDYLSVYIPEKLTGDRVVYSDSKSPEVHYIIAGSILGAAGPASIVWGAGFGNSTDKIDTAKEIRAVRGPLSLQIVESQGFRPAAIGDPALILPRIYNPKITKRYKLGVIPHWIDYYVGMMRFRDMADVKVIDILKKPEEFINDVLECERCISSSLHGIILANAYGIPCAQTILGDRICGDGFKFKDYLALTKLDPYTVNDYRYTPVPVENICKRIPPCPEINTDGLWDSCPWKK